VRGWKRGLRGVVPAELLQATGQSLVELLLSVLAVDEVSAGLGAVELAVLLSLPALPLTVLLVLPVPPEALVVAAF